MGLIHSIAITIYRILRLFWDIVGSCFLRELTLLPYMWSRASLQILFYVRLRNIIDAVLYKVEFARSKSIINCWGLWYPFSMLITTVYYIIVSLNRYNFDFNIKECVQSTTLKAAKPIIPLLILSILYEIFLMILFIKSMLKLAKLVHQPNELQTS